MAALNNLNLERIDLGKSDIVCTSFNNCVLTGASFVVANAKCCDFSNAILKDASFAGSELHGACFDGADLKGACFEGANLTNVSLIGAKNVPFFPTYLPEGEFIGWKPLPGDVIAKIKIMEDSKRSRALEEICRCDKCIVLEFQDIKGNKLEETEFSYCNLGVYTIGEFSHSGYWDEDRWNPYGGITFYVAKQSAINRLMEG